MAAEEESGLRDGPGGCSGGSFDPFLAAIEVRGKSNVKKILMDAGGGQKEESICLSVWVTSDEKTFCAVAALNHVSLTLMKCTTEPETWTPFPKNSLL